MYSPSEVRCVLGAQNTAALDWYVTSVVRLSHISLWRLQPAVTPRRDVRIGAGMRAPGMCGAPRRLRGVKPEARCSSVQRRLFSAAARCRRAASWPFRQCREGGHSPTVYDMAGNIPSSLFVAVRQAKKASLNNNILPMQSDSNLDYTMGMSVQGGASDCLTAANPSSL